LPFREPSFSLRDIFEAVNMIEEFTARMDFGAFREDPKTVAAVERKLLVTSGAAIRLWGRRHGPLSRAAMGQNSWDRKLASASVRPG
jgi:hypothetical protein